MNLIYTPTAWLSLDKSINFLRLQEVPGSKISEIVDEVFKKAETLKKFPYSGQKETMLFDRKNLYRRLVIRYFKIVYFIEGENVHVVAIFDTRQDPEKLKADLL
ncbi:MAG: type II toxin-antitoxin system RelE/ParE family toxin [Cyclobacteriaceae bacterium]